MHTRQEQLQAFDRLLTVMNDLREKCPWDRKQTFDSLRQNTIEEANELSAAIIKQDMTEISKELGDVLLHIVFYAKIASEQSRLTLPMCATAYATNSSSVIRTSMDKKRLPMPKRCPNYGSRSNSRRKTATILFWEAYPTRCRLSSKRTAFKTKQPTSVLTGKRKKMSGTK